MRRHSFHTANQAPPLHKTMSNTSTIPEESVTFSNPRRVPAIRRHHATLRSQDSRSPPSSNGSMAWSDDVSDTEASTPPSIDDEMESSFNEKEMKSPRRRRASTNLITSTAEDIQRLLGDSSTGTKFLQKYCCGEGCCKLQKIPTASNAADFKPIAVPDNEAYQSLNIQLYALTLDTPLSGMVDLPPQTIELLPLDSSIPAARKSAASRQVHPPQFVQPHPPYDVFSAPLFHARELTKPGAEKRTYHFDLDITDYPEEGGVEFKVGGAIGVCPPNDPEIVDDIFNQLGVPKFVRDKQIKVKTAGGRWPTIWGEEESRELVSTRRELLTWCSDITSTPPTKPLFRLLGEYATTENEKKILLFLASAQGQASFCDLRTGPFITISQLLHAFPSSKPPIESLFAILPQLMPRFYSLSNDPFESSAREGIAGRKLVEVAVTVHETNCWRGEKRTGVGSGFLERIARRFIAETEDAHQHDSCLRKETLDIRVPMFRGLMANPLSREFASDGPMMLIGAGVGMAPFRGFILNRLRNANCANKIWLVQGVRDSMLDEIYAGELGTHEKDIKKVVQSRVQGPPPVAVKSQDGMIDGDSSGEDQEGNAVVVDPLQSQRSAKYVQDEVRFQADIVWFVINAIDGRIFVCGSTKGMGEGVEEALVDVAMDKGSLNREAAEEFWKEKKQSGQYIAETW